MIDNTQILVLGAGELGLSMIQALVSHPTKPNVSVLLRPVSEPNKARQELAATLDSLHISVLDGELTAPVDSLARLFAPFHTIISCIGFSAGKGSQLRICHAVLQARVRRYVPWQFGVDYDAIGRGSSQDLFDEQLDVRHLLRSQDDTKWTIVSTGMFTSFLFEPSFGVVDMERSIVRALGSWENEVTVTSAEDIGRLTASVLLDDKEVMGGVIKIAGDTTTFSGIADLLRGMGCDIKQETWTLEDLEEQLREKPTDKMLKYQVVWARNVGVSWPKDETYNARKGILVEDLKTWAEKNLKKPVRG
ncbi:hypothetical protein FRB94_003302 [Tulasnella sp. JGI-2019a]|nr:hypothetical protein FRB94_003302 [Tulasnella sp. JGI-2019a]